MGFDRDHDRLEVVGRGNVRLVRAAWTASPMMERAMSLRGSNAALLTTLIFMPLPIGRGDLYGSASGIKIYRLAPPDGSPSPID